MLKIVVESLVGCCKVEDVLGTDDLVSLPAPFYTKSNWEAEAMRRFCESKKLLSCTSEMRRFERLALRLVMMARIFVT